MNEYRLTFEAISPLSLEKLSQVFYEQFDGVLVERAGQIIVTVYIEGATAVDAAYIAIDHLEKLDLSICHADPDLVDGPEISSRLGTSRQAVQNWATGKRSSCFPHPIGSPGGKRIWIWADVVAWAHMYQDSTETPGLTRDELTRVNAYLAERRQLVSSPVWAVKPGSAKVQAGVRGVKDYNQSAVTFRVNE